MDTSATCAASDNGSRGMIAQRVIVWAGAGILSVSVIAIAGFAVALGFDHEKDAVLRFQQNISSIFNALLPLFGTWVGTVLAYYFSKENFLAAANATKSLLGQLDESLQKTRVEDVWKTYETMTKIMLDAGDDGAKTTLGDFKDIYTKSITRIPIFDQNKCLKYLVHQSAFFQYGYKVGLVDEGNRQRTLKDLLEYDDLKETLQTFAVMPPGGTLADAKAYMDRVDGAQDVFVTSHGDRNDPVLGWVTNADIVKKLKF